MGLCSKSLNLIYSQRVGDSRMFGRDISPPSSGSKSGWTCRRLLLILIFNPEGESNMFLRMVGIIPNYTALQRRRLWYLPNSIKFIIHYRIYRYNWCLSRIVIFTNTFNKSILLSREPEIYSSGTNVCFLIPAPSFTTLQTTVHFIWLVRASVTDSSETKQSLHLWHFTICAMGSFV